MSTPQAQEIEEAEALLGGLPIRTGAAFVIHGGLVPSRLAETWDRCAERISRDGDGRRVVSWESLQQDDGVVTPAVRESADRAALARRDAPEMFSRLHRMNDGSHVWSVFVHHSVLDGVGLMQFMAVVREHYIDEAAEWPEADWSTSRRLAGKMFEHRRKAEARVRNVVADDAPAAPVLIGSKRRSPTVPRVTRLGRVRPRWRPAPGAGAPDRSAAVPTPLSALAWLCGYVAVLLMAHRDEPTVQLSIPRAGVDRRSSLPLGTFAYTLPLLVRRPERATVGEFLDGIADDLRYNRWSEGFRNSSLRRSFGPNVNLFPAPAAAGTDPEGGCWRYALLSSGPVEDIDIVCALDGEEQDVHLQVGMAGLDAADVRQLTTALGAVLVDFAGSAPKTPLREVLAGAREHLAPVARIGRELTALLGASAAVDADRVRNTVARVLAERFGPDPGNFDFFECGGSSRDAVTLTQEISRAVGRPVDPSLLYYFPTFDEFVTAVRGGADGQPARWTVAGEFDIIGTGARSAADSRSDIVRDLVRELLTAWRSEPAIVPAPDPATSRRAGAQVVAGTVTTTEDGARISAWAEWLTGESSVRLLVRGDARPREGTLLGAVERAVAVAGLGAIVHSAVGEVVAE